MTLFLCNWYKREELGFRIAFLFSKFNDDRTIEDYR